VTDPDHRRRRRHSSDSPGWRSDRARPLILLAGIFAIVLVAAGLAFVLGGGPGGTTAPLIASATASLAAGPGLPASQVPGTGSAGPSDVPLQSASPGSPSPSTVDGAPGIQANRIKIDRLGIDLAIIQGDGIDAPIGKAAHYPSSAWPGGGSNIYIYGHARTGMFIRLWDARVGDTVQLGLVDGTSRTYVVTKVLPTVPWDAVQYLQPTPTEQLTLQTSTSYYPTAPRFVLIALPAP
jgi:LPXTG-site transpeptidase (sortase) family protein